MHVNNDSNEYQASILYFCVSDLSPIDPMYQFSLLWFVSLFEKCIHDSPQSESGDNLNIRFNN